jgi:hypothetical protein
MKTIKDFQEKYGEGWMKKWNAHKTTKRNTKTHTKDGSRRRKFWNEFDYYRENVKKLTNKNCHVVEGIEHRSFYGPHIDHKISVRYGYENNIPAEHIAHTSNLRMLSAKENIAKKDSILIDDLNRWILGQ